MNSFTHTETSSLLICPATFSDIQAIAELEKQNYASDGYPPMFLYQALVQWPEGLWVAKINQTLIGYSLTVPAQQNAEYWLMAALVSPEGRGKGAGKRLCQAAIKACAEFNATTLWLSVDPQNSTAIGLYNKIGFNPAGTRTDFLGPGEHRMLMRYNF